MPTRNFEFSIGEFYHLYNRGVEKRNIFEDDYDRERFLKLLYLCNSEKPLEFRDLPDGLPYWLPKGETLVDIGVYCLMANHFHLLVQEKKEGGISLFMQKLATAHSMFFNKKYERTGRLFEATFRVKHLDSNPYLEHMFAYIHLNPADHIEPGWKEKGIKDLQATEDYLNNYKFSSYLDYVGRKRPEGTIINKKILPDYFSGEEKDYSSSLIDIYLKASQEETGEMENLWPN